LGGVINAVMQEYTDPETAAAGEKKAAAKEILENPHADHSATAEKIAGRQNETKTSEEIKFKNNRPETVLEKLEAEDKPVDKKSVFKLIAGVVIGFVSSRKK
jgi:hypothetical protein